MAFQPDPDEIVWRLHLASPPAVVFDALDSASGRAAFWAESADEQDGVIRFEFINGMSYAGRVLERTWPDRWVIDYFGSTVTFTLANDGQGGTDLTLVDHGASAENRTEVTAGWLNVLLPLKAWVDHGIDLRNHDPTRTWDEGYVDQ